MMSASNKMPTHEPWRSMPGTTKTAAYNEIALITHRIINFVICAPFITFLFTVQSSLRGRRPPCVIQKEVAAPLRYEVHAHKYANYVTKLLASK
jgi:hypothetical protein